ncbi:sensor histidine kinase [Geomesophilobacter sediminis]|uniref:histidine kinase n=1 Tax=Geomesophilobacter sediminis TaxID=2798584 RepID=A0A8J7S8D4_9BACT|nr:ATP-binding protein [Geomesophilobacter sediminis]MBJ6727601.1 two-component sensor histidine kinase [Geomesophilobacter sediminis]
MTGMLEEKGLAEGKLLNDKQMVPEVLNSSYAVDLKAAVHTSLQSIRNMLTEKPNNEDIDALTQQIERLLTEQTDRLESINRDLEAFNYSVAHDLCAPLTRICGFTRALQEQYGDRLDSQGLDYLERIFKSSQHMNELVEALLQLSQLSYQNIKREVVDLSEIAADTAQELRSSAPDRIAEFLIQPRIRTFGDANLLEIVIKNLMRNAWKFTRTRATTFIEFGARDVAADKACFVRDNGIGFDMSDCEKMFHAFQRLHNGTDFPGNGVGLTTVQRIINRHGGRIWAEGEVDKGATFYFTLQSCIT